MAKSPKKKITTRFCAKGKDCFCDLGRAQRCGNFRPPSVSIYDLLGAYGRVLERQVARGKA
jgi:hypothetical protein